MPKAFPKLLGVEISIPYRIFKLSNINDIDIIINNFLNNFLRETDANPKPQLVLVYKYHINIFLT